MSMYEWYVLRSLYLVQIVINSIFHLRCSRGENHFFFQWSITSFQLLALAQQQITSSYYFLCRWTWSRCDWIRWREWRRPFVNHFAARGRCYGCHRRSPGCRNGSSGFQHMETTHPGWRGSLKKACLVQPNIRGKKNNFNLVFELRQNNPWCCFSLIFCNGVHYDCVQLVNSGPISATWAK